MSDETEAAYILFGADKPKSAEPPDWYKADQAAAESRLMRVEPSARAQAAQDGSKPDQPASAGPAADAAEKLFTSESGTDYGQLVSGELDAYTLGAIQDGDTERSEALKHATSALAEDMRTAGTEPATLGEAFEIVRQSAGMVPLTAEQREESFAAGMAAIQSERITEPDLSAARAFIRDLDRVSPGVVDSLRAHGAGNDIRLIRNAIAEARRRGY